MIKQLLQLAGFSKDYIIALLAIYCTLLLGYKLSPLTVSWFMACFLGAMYAKIRSIEKLFQQELHEKLLAYLLSYPLAFLFSVLGGILMGMYFGGVSLSWLAKSFVACTVLSLVTYFVAGITHYLEQHAKKEKYFVYPIIILFISSVLVLVDIWLA